MRLGFGHSLNSGNSLLADFSPNDLFTGGAVGDWWDPSNLNKVFQESAGITPGAINQPVGLIRGMRGYADLKQSSDPVRPSLRSSGGQIFVEGDASSELMQVETSTALFKFLHDGTGGSLIAVCSSAGVGNQTMWGNVTSVAQVGVFLARIDVSQRIQYAVGNGVSAVVSIAPAGSVWPAATPVVVAGSYRNLATASDGEVYVNGAEIASQLTAAAPSAADATGNLRGVLNSTTIVNRFWFYMAISRKLTDPEMLTLAKWAGTRAGLSL